MEEVSRFLCLWQKHTKEQNKRQVGKFQFKLILNEDYWSLWQLKGFPKI